MRRRGRPRKLGRRKPSGRLAQARAPSVAEIAAAMPHRRALGKKAASQLAESELGRMCCRGELEQILFIAGEHYRNDWRGYVATLAAPRSLAVTSGGVSRCDGCLAKSAQDYCQCEQRMRRWNEVKTALVEIPRCARFVDAVCLYDRPIERDESFALLRIGLQALAQHYLLTPRAKVISVRNRSVAARGTTRPRLDRG